MAKASVVYAKLLKRLDVILIVFFVAIVGYVISSSGSPDYTKKIDEEYYYTHQTTGMATSSNHRHIKVYKQRAWLPDKKIAHLDLIDYSGREDIDIRYQLNRLQLIIDKQIELDTIINEKQTLEMDFNAFDKNRKLNIKDSIQH